MAHSPNSNYVAFALVFLLIGTSSAQLSENFYSKKCPKVFDTVKSVVRSAVAKEPRIGASLLRLFFHDCFVDVIFLLSYDLIFVGFDLIFSFLAILLD
jgi:peroxidase